MNAFCQVHPSLVLNPLVSKSPSPIIYPSPQTRIPDCSPKILLKEFLESYKEFWIWTIESGWSWSGCSTTLADSWIDICGDGEGAAVKDDAAIVDTLN